jgi:hypothetical protein
MISVPDRVGFAVGEVVEAQPRPEGLGLQSRKALQNRSKTRKTA